MLYDVFICHASEDKDSFVRPLAALLRERHIEVWFDEFTLRLGDSLRRAIDAGLRQSRFGVVVLSKAFFSKQWPQYELDGLAAREMCGNDRVLLPIWHAVTLEDVMGYSPSLAGRVAVASAEGLQKVADAILRAVHPQGSPLLVARDTLLEYGLTPPVITDSYWLDVVEASNRVPGAGATIPQHSHWGRWSFPLPWTSDDAFDRGERLARTAMQMRWTEAAEELPVTILTHPDHVHQFVESHPGLLDACSGWPDLLVEYAPQLAIPGFEGDLYDIVESGYRESCRRSEATRRASPTFGTALTTDHEPPACDEEWAIRHPEFGRYEPAMVANAYFAGGIFGPEVSPYEHADHLFWLLSEDSNWLPERFRLFLKAGMADWAVWHWFDVRGVTWPNMGELFTQLSASKERRKKTFTWTQAAEEDLLNRIRHAVSTLNLSDSVEHIHDEFMTGAFADRHVLANLERRARHRAVRRQAAGSQS